jgi:hypothetical protein
VTGSRNGLFRPNGPATRRIASSKRRKPDKTTDEKLGASMKNTRSDAVAGGLPGVSTTFPKRINLATHRAKMRLVLSNLFNFERTRVPRKAVAIRKQPNIMPA